MIELPAALAALAQYRQFLCYVMVPSRSRQGKVDKFPVSPLTGQVCNAHDPALWVSGAEACASAQILGPSHGVAFVFTKADPFFFVDIDSCLQSDGHWSPLANEVAQMFPGAAVEISQSGKGLHIIARGTAPAHGCRNPLGLEFYTEARFVALTGTAAQGDAGTDHTAALHALTARYFPAGAHAESGEGFALSSGPVDAWRGPEDDADLLRRALMSRSAASAFGGRASFADLWHGEAEALGRAYPDSGGRPYDASAADAALASHLAFWTGRDGERIARLMRQSALARDKWDREDYLPRTIAAILSQPGDVLQDKAPEPVALLTPTEGAAAPECRDVNGETFLGVPQQKEFFKGCVYILDRHRVLAPGGHLMRPEQFRAYYGGYTFAMDQINERTTRNAWEAFTESQALRSPRADSVCFRPDLEPGALVNDAGRSRANAYWPAEVARRSGDVGPFLRHLEKMLPDERDRAILLAYMAACVQHKGVKFGWAPVIQGCEGNGKTLLAVCVAEACGRHYTHWTDADGIASRFNGWVADKLFVAVEELRGQEHSAEEIVELLKTFITGGFGVRVEYKGVDETTLPIVANFMLLTNHKNAVRKTPDNNRRLAVFYTAQQHKSDLDRQGMGGSYFPTLWAWLRSEGFAYITDFLHTYPIPDELNPATMAHRAPDTSTSAQVAVDSRGGVEQHIAEVIAQDTPGFMGGWVSSVALDRFLTDTLRMGARLPLAKRREMLASLGYVPHPGLKDGRTNNVVQPDGRRPVLYVLTDHPAARLTDAAEIARAYTAAQQVKPGG